MADDTTTSNGTDDMSMPDDLRELLARAERDEDSDVPVYDPDSDDEADEDEITLEEYAGE